MARRIPLHPIGAAQRLVRYLQSGRVLRQRMYAATPIPFLRRLHLIPEQAYFTELSSNLPAWWASDERLFPGFEFGWNFLGGVDEWAGDSTPTRADLSTVDQSIGQTVPSLPDASTERGVARPAEVSGRERAAGHRTLSIGAMPPASRTFVRPVRAQDVARPISARRARAAVTVTGAERPIVAP